MVQNLTVRNFKLSIPKIVFGVGSSENLVKKVKEIKAKKVIFITDKGITKIGLIKSMKVSLEDNGIEVGIFDEVEQEPSIKNAELATKIVYQGGYNLVIGVGGGSAIDIAKVAAVMGKSGKSICDYIGMDKIPNRGLQKILIPTTAGTGSEVTQISVLKEKEKEKRTAVVYSKYLLADIAIIDPKLLLSLPSQITANTGMDALSHAIEAYTCTKSNLATDMFAIEAIGLIISNLRTAVFKGKDIEARVNTMLGSTLAGVAFANSGLGAVHALAYPFGIKYGMAHGLSNGIILPWVMKYNYPSVISKYAKIAEVIKVNKPSLSIKENAKEAIKTIKILATDIGIPQKLIDIGIKKEEIAEFAEIALKYSSHLLKVNPRVCKKEDIVNIYEEALNNRWEF